ncbi:hypothetical protein [Polynucleobacter sp. UK-Mo-2m-Kol15]|uniref:hypothetical protein n=1 Tax=Polynucleobacter sp. UK-Mo-2m-Kol15 TaxID=2576916 RepID=UPI001C0E8D63|nr:hypothetical protein [Polynucleobacter sp. UK-Mo-2m-Kol15]MBU3576063.1 ACP S-malonyltransferase [Polynucleobacter sp. UK-Mo-2m-Kol15]
MIFLFPTFPMRSPEFDISKISGLSDIYQLWLERAKKCAPLNLALLDDPRNNSASHAHITEQAHYACIIENVSMAQWVTENLGKCDRASSYSMGFFSALVHSNALDFESTMRLVQSICNQAHEALKETPWAVGAVVEFPVEKLNVIMSDVDSTLEITDFYGPHTILFTGLASSVKVVLDRSLEEGATLTRLIPLTAPFHTTTLLKISPELNRLVSTLDVRTPSWPILSSLSQKWLTTADDICAEIRSNIAAPMNWNLTMKKIAILDSGTIVECGASVGLTDLAKQMLSSQWKCLDFKDFEKKQ